MTGYADFSYLQIRNTKQFSRLRRKKSEIKAIIIHDTGNYGKGSGAMNHKVYLERATRYGSAHVYIDDTDIIQTLGDTYTAWSVGDQWGYKNNPNRYKNLNNRNTFSIEMCMNEDGDYERMYRNTVEYVKNLLDYLNLTPDDVYRHYDVTGKSCPDHMKANNWQRWWKFKQDIREPKRVIYNLKKYSSKPVTVQGEQLKMENKTVKYRINGVDKEVRGFMKDSTNYVSIRDIFEGLGYEVSWNGDKVIVNDKK